MGSAIATPHEMNAMRAQNQTQHELVGPNVWGSQNPTHIQTHDFASGQLLNPSRIGRGTSETTEVHTLPENGLPYHPQTNPLQRTYGSNNPTVTGDLVGPGRSDGYPTKTTAHLGPNVAVVSHAHPYIPRADSFKPSQGDTSSSSVWNQHYAEHYPLSNPPTSIHQAPAPTPNDPNPYMRYDGRTNSYVHLVDNPNMIPSHDIQPNQGFNVVQQRDGAYWKAPNDVPQN